MTAEKSTAEPHEDSNQESENPIDGDVAVHEIEAYSELNEELDEINTCLDAIERKTDTLHAQIFKLLEESKQIRSELNEPDESSSS